jgi:hypothetical protein
MAGNHLTTTSTIMCPHGGQAVLTTANTRVSADRANVLLESDIHTIAGCSFMMGSTYSPCVRIDWSAGTGRVSINGQATLVTTSIGQCLNASGAAQGVATIVNTQQKATAQ